VGWLYGICCDLLKAKIEAHAMLLIVTTHYTITGASDEEELLLGPPVYVMFVLQLSLCLASSSVLSTSYEVGWNPSQSADHDTIPVLIGYLDWRGGLWTMRSSWILCHLQTSSPTW
jgi:hypothetical protein